jgi:protein SCO1/2
VSYLSLGLTLGTGAAMLWWFDHEKAKKMEMLAARDAVVVGSAKMGGPFELVDAQGRQFTDADLLGAFSLLYFGFTYCPDVCPEELEKVAAATDLVGEASGAPA